MPRQNKIPNTQVITLDAANPVVVPALHFREHCVYTFQFAFDSSPVGGICEFFRNFVPGAPLIADEEIGQVAADEVHHTGDVYTRNPPATGEFRINHPAVDWAGGSVKVFIAAHIKHPRPGFVYPSLSEGEN